MTVLHDGVKVAVTIDSDAMPFKVLLIRGAVRTDTVDGIAPEYEATTMLVLGQAEGRARLNNSRPICPQMSRVFIKPEWVGILDFETRFPNALERAMEQAQSQA
ncbi:hypothetical protein BH20CHL3_BH20CHL3_09150 [soil metagenome]